MALQPVIRLGDTTSHGGIVVEGFTNHIVLGIPVAGLGHAVKCPKCKGVYPIVECIKSYTVDGVGVAVHGMLPGCGSVLFASQNLFFLDRGEGESHIGVKKDSVLIAHEPSSASSAFGYDLFFHFKEPGDWRKSASNALNALQNYP
jgi:uncharacterized Zn-binding protein involved in type VI secretion